mgnify:CR=1 FL=1
MTHESKRIGLVLMNLGTPDAPDRASVKRYLKEFLADPLVVTAPSMVRWAVSRGVATFRSKQSAHAYQTVWTEEGSPLLVHSKAHAEAVAHDLKDQYSVRVAMRYGNPGLLEAVASLKEEGCDSYVLMPVYPQYAEVTTLSCLRKLQEVCEALGLSLDDWRWVPPFYAHPDYIQAYTEFLRPRLEAFGADCVLMSFHGLPVKQLDEPICCVSTCDRVNTVCPSISATNARCYRAHCFATARGLAKGLGLNQDHYTVGFQSRLGKLPWIGPDSVAVLDDLYAKGVRRLAVMSPAFVSDCLETDEELGIAMKETWCKKPDTSFALLPCLNASDEWVKATQRLLSTAVPVVLTEEGRLA